MEERRRGGGGGRGVRVGEGGQDEEARGGGGRGYQRISAKGDIDV